MKTIGIVGNSQSSCIIEYCREIQAASNRINGENIPLDILAYAFNPGKDHNENITKIIDAFFHVASGTNLVIQCDAYMEFLWDHITIKVKRLKLTDCILEKIGIPDLKKIAILSANHNREHNFLSRSFQKKGIQPLVLPESHRRHLRNILKRNRLKKELTKTQQIIMQQILNQIKVKAIPAIVVTSEALYELLQKNEQETTIIHSRQTHIEAIAAYIND